MFADDTPLLIRSGTFGAGPVAVFTGTAQGEDYTVSGMSLRTAVYTFQKQPNTRNSLIYVQTILFLFVNSKSNIYIYIYIYITFFTFT